MKIKNLSRRKFVKALPVAGIFLAAIHQSTARAEMGSALVPCAHCGTGFRVEFSYSSGGGGYNVYQCPKCHQGSRVHWDHKGNVTRVERA